VHPRAGMAVYIKEEISFPLRFRTAGRPSHSDLVYQLNCRASGLYGASFYIRLRNFKLLLGKLTLIFKEQKSSTYRPASWPRLVARRTGRLFHNCPRPWCSEESSFWKHKKNISLSLCMSSKKWNRSNCYAAWNN